MVGGHVLCKRLFAPIRLRQTRITNEIGMHGSREIGHELPSQISHGKLSHTPELDGIRGWACLSVLIAHTITGPFNVPELETLMFLSDRTLWLFLSGVDLFFVLSGFLIGGILIDSRNKPLYFRHFWIRRFGRIFPVAYLVLATYAVALYVTTNFGITRFDNWLLAEPRPPLWTFATFTQSFPIASGGYGGPRWMAMTWSLAIEEQFYLLFPLAVYFLPRRWLVAIVISGIIAAPIFRDLLERLYGHWYAPYVLLPSRMDALLYGVGLALIVRNKAAFEIAKSLRRFLDVIGIVILYSIVSRWVFPLWPGPSGAIYPLKQSLMAILWAILILRVFTFEQSWFNRVWRNSVLRWIGLISYALYMYHQAVNGLIHGILFGQEPVITNFAHLLTAIIVIAISILLAAISYYYFEKPIRDYCSKLSSRMREKVPSPQTQEAH